jgi:AraC-like DNA-binding protein
MLTTSCDVSLVLTPPDAFSWPERKAADIESVTARIIKCARDELGHLVQILRALGGHAFVRQTEGDSVPVAGDTPRHLLETDRQARLSAPIYDANGDTLAFLDVLVPKSSWEDLPQKLLASLINSVARGVSERWFRLRYRRQWIIAALRHPEGVDFITLAVDRQNRVVGADHCARDLLRDWGLQVGAELSLSAVFQGCAAPLRTRRFCDAAVTLVGVKDGASWSVLVTPPDSSADSFGQSERVLVHARPRSGALTSVGLPSARQDGSFGLPPRMLRRVSEYIDAHLDATLDIPELANYLGISESHFARRFRQSTGLTPHSYVMRRRLTRAQELLSSTDRAMVDIALTTGFADQSHFSRRFHELTGVAPGIFRAMHR